MAVLTKRASLSYCIGIDASLTSTGVYCLPIGHEEWYGWSAQTKPTDGTDTVRIMNIACDIIDCVANLPHSPAVIAFEDYGPINRTSGKIAQRAEMVGVMKYHSLRQLQIPVVTVTPTALKQFATGKGNAGKGEMLDAACRAGYYPDTHDEADAFFVARIAAALYHGEPVTVDYTVVKP